MSVGYWTIQINMDEERRWHNILSQMHGWLLRASEFHQRGSPTMSMNDEHQGSVWPCSCAWGILSNTIRFVWGKKKLRSPVTWFSLKCSGIKSVFILPTFLCFVPHPLGMGGAAIYTSRRHGLPVILLDFSQNADGSLQVLSMMLSRRLHEVEIEILGFGGPGSWCGTAAGFWLVSLKWFDAQFWKSNFWRERTWPQHLSIDTAPIKIQ